MWNLRLKLPTYAGFSRIESMPARARRRGYICGKRNGSRTKTKSAKPHEERAPWAARPRRRRRRRTTRPSTRKRLRVSRLLARRYLRCPRCARRGRRPRCRLRGPRPRRRGRARFRTCRATCSSSSRALSPRQFRALCAAAASCGRALKAMLCCGARRSVACRRLEMAGACSLDMHTPF